LAQRSTWSITFWWLGRRGFGASGSSDSLRGNLTSSVMANLPLQENAPARDSFQYNLLILLYFFTNLGILPILVELPPNEFVEQTTHLTHFV
jgi:hypothetical protein